ncbi:FmdE family protein [Desulfotignum balticum]|jgi:formylmethanofuran dehydrogenase subunit E|uniref:FmdE family protein n=1 Tax=Desulfotignum balticum TaxID=115781 RepID=UPI00040F4B2D|nr:FmdE family protein [Desulfotignum balticum]
METFEVLLQESAKAHGHLCPGQVVGVRMAMEGCRRIGLDNPRERSQIKKLIVYVEMDRCAADAISTVTGARLGRRSLKFVDNGIMAATFVNLETGKAVRIVSKESARSLAASKAPQIRDRHRQQLEAYKTMACEDLFDILAVKVDVDDCDMPGPTKFKAVCQKCGQVVRDKREVMKNNRILCRPCALGTYFTPVQDKESDKKEYEKQSQSMAV